MHPLNLSADNLMEIALDFENKGSKGLISPNQQIRCLPTYISLEGEGRNGKAIVLDLGGSNLRAGIALCEMGQWTLIKRSPNIRMPWQRNDPFSQEQFLSIQAKALSELDNTEELPLGYCFSYPAEPTPDRDVKLLKWAKGIDVPRTLGQKMGQLLLSYMAVEYPEIKCTEVTVINDTVAALIGGMADSDTTSTIGLIAGTGTNMAAALDPTDIPKISMMNSIIGKLPVNLESGNFSPACLTEWDDIVDRNSNNPGEQRFEKAVSGAYLGHIFKALFPDSLFDAGKGGAELVKILNDPGRYPMEWSEFAAMIYYRSADLVAAALSGLIRLLQKLYDKRSIRIVAEGALFWGQLGGQFRYRDRVASTLDTLLSMLDLNPLHIEFFKKEDTNLIGSAIAALA